EGIFYAKLICAKKNAQETVEIDARTSDSIALAVRFNCAVYTYEFILTNAGIVLEDDPTLSATEETESEPEIEISDITTEDELGNLSKEELQIKLNEAINNEDYEKASAIRDEINRRKSFLFSLSLKNISC